MRGVETDTKSYFDGTHRVVDPAATLRRVRCHAAAAGITRLGMITGLDRVGIPVAVACRPNSRSLATFQGKGTTPDAARASAFMEALEVFHAETMTLPIVTASWNALRDTRRVVDPHRLPLCRDSLFAQDRPIPWVSGRDLRDGAETWVPHELVTACFTHPQPPGSHCFAASTNGLASGNTELEAITHALYETIERDAIAVWLADGPTRDAARALAIEAAISPCARDLIARCETAGLRIALWNVTSDIAVPVVVCVLQGADERIVDMGSGCHADREIALLRAITEAAQARLTRIAGSRDDLDDATYPADPGHGNASQALFETTARGDIAALPHFAGTTLRQDLDATCAALARIGIEQIIHVDLSRPEIAVPVARVIVPGLEGPAHAAGLGYVPGARAQARRRR